MKKEKRTGLKKTGMKKKTNWIYSPILDNIPIVAGGGF